MIVYRDNEGRRPGRPPRVLYVFGGLIKIVTPERRKCLGPICMGQTTFMSSGPGNRLCQRCQVAAGREVDDQAAASDPGRGRE